MKPAAACHPSRPAVRGHQLCRPCYWSVYVQREAAKPAPIQCPVCGGWFRPEPRQRVCSAECKAEAARIRQYPEDRYTLYSEAGIAMVVGVYSDRGWTKVSWSTEPLEPMTFSVGKAGKATIVKAWHEPEGDE